MNINDAYPSNYLKASDLGGKRVTVTMTGVKTEEVGKDKEPKAVLYFKGTKKGMVLNRTNARKISEAYGQDTENWYGQQVELYEAQVEFSGNTVPALRVGIPKGPGAASVAAQRPLDPAPKAAAKPYSAADLDDDIPF